MSKSLPIDTYPALQLLLLRRLQEVICLRSDVSAKCHLSTTLKIEARLRPGRESESSIPLQRVKGKLPILYSSAIALQLAKPYGQPALELAAAIAEQFSLEAIAQSVSDRPEPKNRPALKDSSLILRDFTVKVEPPGWLYFELAPAGLADWLQVVTQATEPLLSENHDFIAQQFTAIRALPNDAVSSSSHVFDAFAVQYAHARCCSLLRLADDQPAIASSTPWLNAAGELQFRHAAEYNLIFALIDTVDDLLRLIESAIACAPACLPPEAQFQVERLATALAQAFLNFYDACRFWGEVRQQDPALVQARFGLVAATQQILQSLLEEFLGLTAPVEL